MAMDVEHIETMSNGTKLLLDEVELSSDEMELLLDRTIMNVRWNLDECRTEVWQKFDKSSMEVRQKLNGRLIVTSDGHRLWRQPDVNYTGQRHNVEWRGG